MEFEYAELAESFKEIPRLPQDFDPLEEAEYMHEILTQQLAEELADYSEPRAVGVGANGVVISAVYTPFGTRRALKLPRKRVYLKALRGNTAESDVDPEEHALTKMSHKNIIRLYSAIRLRQNAGTCMIMEFIPDAEPLDNYAEILCCSEEVIKNTERRNIAIDQLANIILDIVSALKYMHTTARLIHFDIKPDNILVSRDGIPYITDLGFARDTTRYEEGQLVDIGFTWKYAHRAIADPHGGARISQSPAKSKNEIKAEKIKPYIDLFSFGRSLQEVLKRLEDVYKERIHTHYFFNYLHVVACLCLDGRNAANGGAPRKDFVSDTALGLPVILFKTKRFESFERVEEALERLLGHRRVEQELPELDRWAAGTINVSDMGITTLTPRVRETIDHPLLDRLSGEVQLGMLSKVFPTATHTRLQHTLGVYHAVSEYILALYYEPENPIFRVLFDKDKCKEILLVSLLHDIGQSTFGHELEEVDGESFSHVEIGRELIKKTRDIKDTRGRSLHDIIQYVWKADTDDITNLLEGRIEDPFTFLLHDMIDGQLDADKLDYLIRDSVETRVQYGLGIDHGRFLRSLTVMPERVGRKVRLRLAIKQKGAASAEAFALARYQLYQAVYWHHTFRAIKGMFITAADAAIERLIKEYPAVDMFEKEILRRAYIESVLGVELDAFALKPTRERKGKKKSSGKTTLGDEVKHRLLGDNPELRGAYGEDSAIQFVWKLADDKERQLLRDLTERRLYRRVFEIPLSELTESNWMELRKKMQSRSIRLKLLERVSDALDSLLRSQIQDQSLVRESVVEDKMLARMSEVVGTRYPFVIDLPTRGMLADGQAPGAVVDYKRRHFRADVAREEARRSRLWSEYMPRMMREIAFFRVYAEPEMHELIRTVLDADSITEAITECLPELGS